MLPSRESVWIGWDPREAAAFAIARESCKRYLTRHVPVNGLLLSDLQEAGLYTRPLEYRASAADKPVMWDVVSDAPMATEHACARFFIYHLAKCGWALFTDGDVLFRSNVCRLFESLDNSKAVYCVKHKHAPMTKKKMDGQVQTAYPRKNWSSVFCMNISHESNRALTLDFLNTTPGRDLHAFCWLKDQEIGSLNQSWNFLVGHTDPEIEPDICHFTEGVPDMPGYGHQPFASEWFKARADWARGRRQ